MCMCVWVRSVRVSSRDQLEFNLFVLSRDLSIFPRSASQCITHSLWTNQTTTRQFNRMYSFRMDGCVRRCHYKLTRDLKLTAPPTAHCTCERFLKHVWDTNWCSDQINRRFLHNLPTPMCYSSRRVQNTLRCYGAPRKYKYLLIN